MKKPSKMHALMPVGQRAGLPARQAATSLVLHVVDNQAIFEDLLDGDKGLKSYLSLSLRDRSLARAIALTSLRNRQRILAALQKCWKRTPPKNARLLLFGLEVAAAQILYMDVPARAAVDLAISSISNDPRTQRFSGFANAVLRKLAENAEKFKTQVADISPFPDWMRKALGRDYGKQKAAHIGEAIYQTPYLDISTKAGYAPEFEGCVQLSEHSYRLQSDEAVENLPGFENGSWWVQDVAAAQAVKLLGDVSGKRVADLCAAPGGKTMQLASLGAQVTAVDISQRRMQRLAENLERTGLEAELVCADILQWDPLEKFDAVVLDAPCTATGTIRRHPDILWNRSDKDTGPMVELQKALTVRAAHFVKEGGILLYANCSLMKEEGEGFVATLDHPDLALDPFDVAELPGLEFCLNRQGTYRALPSYLDAATFLLPEGHGGMDGFFAARYRVGGEFTDLDKGQFTK